ncbi:MAG: thermonuclease family protein [Candidatus Magasanikbacteria bacterium]|nr:thermonuclease family protein [Candidatus Magasanikbacteria bacterium]
MRLPVQRLARAAFILGLALVAYGWYGSAPAYIGKRTTLVATNQPAAATGTVGQDSGPQVLGEKTISAPETPVVVRVIDGDTIELETGEKVRYIGVDTPETVHPKKAAQCFGKEASNKNKELVTGKKVRLVKDISEVDRYGRLLRYVYLLDGTFVNLELVKEGYARPATFPPDVKYSSAFVAAAREARLAQRGLWAVCHSRESGNP